MQTLSRLGNTGVARKWKHPETQSAKICQISEDIQATYAYRKEGGGLTHPLISRLSLSRNNRIETGVMAF
jgi:hypothetical protein